MFNIVPNLKKEDEQIISPDHSPSFGLARVREVSEGRVPQEGHLR